MRCLKCWAEIRDEVALFTKSCLHVFCTITALWHGKRCSDKAFKKEMSCPLCDTVLAKDGVGEIILRPDDTHIKKTSSKLFGLEPEKLCEVLQLGLDFWVKQKQNESIQHVQELKRAKVRVEEAESKAQKLSKVLEDERLKKKSLQKDKEELQRRVTELEARYAEKARSMRKLSELYSELRQVHKRLESDLRGVHDATEYEVEPSEHRAVDVRTRGESIRNEERPGIVVEDDEGDMIRNFDVGHLEQLSHQEGRDFDEKRRRQRSPARTPSAANSVPMEQLFSLAPAHQSHPFLLNRRHSREAGKGRRRRQHSGIDVESRRNSNGDDSGYRGRSSRKIVH